MNFDWKSFNLNEQIMLGSFAVTVFSFFLTWVDLEFVTFNGFQQQGYIFLVLWIYPIIFILQKKSYNTMVSLILAFINIVFIIWFITTKSVEIYEGESINVAGTGLWLAAVCSLAFCFGCFKQLDEEE